MEDIEGISNDKLPVILQKGQPRHVSIGEAIPEERFRIISENLLPLKTLSGVFTECPYVDTWESLFSKCRESLERIHFGF